MRYRNNFGGNESGGVAIVFAVSIVMLLLIVGLAVDTARQQDIASRMQASLDGASLAAAKMLSDPKVSDEDIRATAVSFFNGAVPTFGVLPTSIAPLNVIIDRSTSSVQLAGSIEVPAFFGRLFALPSTMQIDQTSKVIYDMTAVELSMVLDITGSMNSSNKLSDMKAAAKDVIDTLFDGALNDSSIRIALAPYSASVNAGELATTVSTAPVTSTCPSKPRKGDPCFDTAGVAIDTCVVERTGGNATTDAPPTGSDVLPNVAMDGYPRYTCPNATVVPLSDRTERDTLKAILDGYVASGSTAGHIGTAWGWYLLSPNWASVLPPDSAPGSYGDKSVQKNIIIMTDGIFNTSYADGPGADAATQMASSYAQFQSLCNGIKAEGITVYTVGFDLSDPVVLGHLENCATSASNFYDAKNGSQLKDAFKDIANKLGNLRVAS